MGKKAKDDCIKNTYQRVLFQFDTKLFLCDIHRISRVYFFELCVKNIGNFENVYTLASNVSIYDFIMMALELDESDYSEEIAGPKEEVAESVTATLCQRDIANILGTYFGINIDTKERSIQSIPSLMDGYVPPLLYLPLFLLRLVTEIRWYKEDKIEMDKHLFKQIAMEIARFYQVRPPHFYVQTQRQKEEKKKFGGYFEKNANDEHNLEWILEHVLFRSMNGKCKQYSFHPPKFLVNDGSIVQIACTKQLYKVFERC